MRASTVRTYAAAAAVPAMIVVLAHLAYVWRQHPSSADRQTSAFGHGIGLAVILAAVLADDRSTGSAAVRSPRILLEHVALLGLVALAAWIAGRFEAQSMRTARHT